MQIVLTSLILASFLFGHLVKISLLAPDLRFSFLDVTILVLIISSVPRVHNLSHWVRSNARLAQPWLLFLLWTLMSLVIATPGLQPIQFLVGLLYWLRFAAYTSLPALLCLHFPPHRLRVLLLSTGLMLVLTGAIQYLFFPDVRHLQVMEWDPHYFRVVGTLLDPGFMGIMLILFLLFLWRFPLPNKLHHYLVLGFTYTVLALTYSRSSYFALVMVSSGVSLTRKSIRPVLSIILLLLLTIPLLPRPGGEGVKLERTSTIQARIQNWSNSWAIFQSQPITGVGFNVYRYTQKQAGFLTGSDWLESHSGAGADSSLLFVAATTGSVGLVLFLWLVWSVFSLRALNLGLIAVLTHSLFLNSLFYPFVLFWLVALIALSPKGSRSQSLPSGWYFQPDL